MRSARRKLLWLCVLFTVGATAPTLALDLRMSVEDVSLSSDQARSLPFRTVGGQAVFLLIEARVEGRERGQTPAYVEGAVFAGREASDSAGAVRRAVAAVGAIPDLDV